MNKIASKPIQRFKKGDAFVEIVPDPLVFMEVNEIEAGPGDKDFCIVTWYSLDEKGINAQRRFPMVAVEGEFCNFEPISRNLLKEAKSLMHQYDAEVRQLTDKKKAESLYKDYNRKLIELLPDAEERLALAQRIEKEIVTNKWLDCEEDNYWVEDSEQGSKYKDFRNNSIGNKGTAIKDYIEKNYNTFPDTAFDGFKTVLDELMNVFNF